MPAWVHGIDQIVFTIYIRLLTEISVTRCKRANLRIVVSSADFYQTGISIIAVAGCRGKLIAVASAPCRGDGVTECIWRFGKCNGLCAACFCAGGS